MGAGGDFGHHAAERAVRLVLADDRLGEDLAVAGDQRRRAVVARGFKAEDQRHRRCPLPHGAALRLVGGAWTSYLILGTRGSPLALAQARSVAARAGGRARLAGGQRRDRPDHAPAATGSRTGRWPRSAARRCGPRSSTWRCSPARPTPVGPFDEGCRKRAAGELAHRRDAAPRRRPRPADRRASRSRRLPEGARSARPRRGARRSCCAAGPTCRSCRSAAMSKPGWPRSRAARSTRPCSPPPGSTGSAHRGRARAIPVDVMLPAPGQAAIGIECRSRRR